MNTKGQMGVRLIIMVAIALIAGVIFFQTIAQEVGSSTSTVAVANESLGTMTNGTTLYLTSYRSISDVIIFNATGDVAIPSTNYTVTNNVIHPTTGALTVSVTPSVTVGFGYDVGTSTIDGTAQPLTYIADSGGRAMANLIVIFFALALVAAALFPVLKQKWE